MAANRSEMEGTENYKEALQEAAVKTVKMQCKYPRCPRLIEPGTGYCDEHKPAEDHRNSIRYAEKDSRYSSARWRKRSDQFKREHPVCCACNNAPTKVADHVIPARICGDFWDESNWQPLCARCHNRKRQRERYAK